MQNQLNIVYPFWGGLNVKQQTWVINGLIFAGAFFLARAIFFEAAVPFFIPFWAVIRMRFQDRRLPALLGGIIGAVTLGVGQAMILVLQWLLYEFLTRWRFYKFPKLVNVALAIGLIQIIWQCLMYSGLPPVTVQVYIFYEVLLSFIMAIFMMQFFRKEGRFFLDEWAYERIGAGLIIGGAILTGMQQFVIGYFSLAVFSLHLAICIVAMMGTMAAAILVAAVMGTVFSIAQLSFTGMLVVYTITGILVGASGQLPRLVIVVLSFLPSIFFLLYDATLPLDRVYFVSIVTSAIVFLFLPRRTLQKGSDFFQPPQQDILLERQQWMTSNMLEQLQQFRQFVLFMKELVFERFTTNGEHQTRKIEPFGTCLSCFRYERCWGEQHNGIDSSIQQWFLYKSSDKQRETLQIEEQLKLKCIKFSKLIEELEYQLYNERMNHQFYHGKKMIALQLRDLTLHIDQLMADLSDQAVSYQELEEQILERLTQVNIHCFQVDLLSRVTGNYQIICSIEQQLDGGEELLAERMIVPILFEILDEPFVLEKMSIQNKPFSHVQLSFQSAVRYEVAYDVYSQSKQGMSVSGDSHAVFQLHEGLLGVILSDGMGNSKRAQRESKKLIQMMRDYLSYHLNPETAMHTLHYVMSLKRDLDMYATIDFALIDLQNGALWSWKAGGMSTYIVRGDQVVQIESAAAPVGFMPHYSVEAQKIPLYANDLIFMVSDGIFSSLDSWNEQENYLLLLVRKYAAKNTIPAVILYEVLDAYKQRYELQDDCTVMVMTMQHIKSEWAVFPVPQEIF